jgi:hypothetical protein
MRQIRPILVLLVFILSAPQIHADDDWSPATNIRLDQTQHSDHKPKPWHIRLTLQPNFGLPLGKYYQNFEPGLGYGGELSVRMSNRWALRLMVSRSGIGRSLSETMIAPLGDGSMFTWDFDGGLKAWRASIGVEFHDWPGFEKGRKLLYYFYTGVGLIDNIQSVDTKVYDETGALVITHHSSYTDRRALLDLGGGMMIAVAQNIGVNIGGNVGMVCVTQNTLWTTYILDFKLGLVFFD